MRYSQFNLQEEKSQAKVFSFLDEIELFKAKYTNELPEKLASEIKRNTGGFGGWNRTEDLIEFLTWLYPDNNLEFDYPEIKHEELINIIKKTVEEMRKALFNEKLEIFILPTFSEFKIQNMGGVGGVSLGKGVIYIDFFPKKDWKKNFRESLTHEIPHAVSPFYNPLDMSVGEQIIFDGIAEHFKERFSNPSRSPWTKAISKEKALHIFHDIKKNLDVRDFDYCGEIFYGTGRYPLWTGYTIGYYLIQEYLKNKEVDWKKLVKSDPNDILQEIKKY